MLEIKKSQIHGKGIFTKEKLYKGQLLVCDVLIFEHVSDFPLKDYLYPWTKGKSSMCIGFGSYLNHSDDPNTVIKNIDVENLTKTFMLLDDVDIDQELTIKYSKGWTFDEKGTSIYTVLPRIQE